MKCRYPGCNNEPTRWSRRAFCGEHRGAARTYAYRLARQTDVPSSPVSDKLRRFSKLRDCVAAKFPNATEPRARNRAGYDVVILAPGGLRA
jgi:hypothetical protein